VAPALIAVPHSHNELDELDDVDELDELDETESRSSRKRWAGVWQRSASIVAPPRSCSALSSSLR